MAHQSKNPFDVLRTLTNIRQAVSTTSATGKKSAAAMRFADAGIRAAAQKENEKTVIMMIFILLLPMKPLSNMKQLK